ncbi:hypothetical protein DL93DRAFT_2170817 [Clavulina sp. PMI_390]|nr:hypothetical protein DL93DRAFT_2170817 [Clavulina sp. PMI_390]
MSTSFGHDELQNLIDYLENRKATSDPKTSRNVVSLSSPNGFTPDHIESLGSRQSSVHAELDSLRRALAVVEAEAKHVDTALARATNCLAPVNKLDEQILGDIFEWCCLSVDPDRFGDDKWSSRTFLNRERARVKLLGVCYWWSVVLTNRVSIWRDVYVLSGLPRRDPEAMAMVTRLRLERAKEATIALSVFLLRDMPDEYEDPVAFYAVDDVLVQCLPQCESLHVNYRSTPPGHPLLPLPLPSAFPNLTSLSIQWSRNYDDLEETYPPTVFYPGVLYPQLQELWLHITTTNRLWSADVIFADLFGLDMVDVSAITSLHIDFDNVPDATWSILEHFDGLTKLTLHRRQRWGDYPLSNTGVSLQAITLESLRTAEINNVPYFSSLVRLKAPHLEELTTHGPLDVGGIEHEDVVEESLINGLFSPSPPSLLVALRMALDEWAIHHIPDEHWHNFFATQKRLEILRCPCRNLLVKLLPSIPDAFPRLRLLHLGAEYAFDRRQADDVTPDEIQLLGTQLEALRQYVSSKLPEDVPGLRILIQLGKGSDRVLLPKDFPLSRFRVTPHDEPWITHPKWTSI